MRSKLFYLFIFLATIVNSQVVVVDSLEMPVPNDTLKYRSLSNYQGMYSDTGPNYVWNFLNLSTNNEVADTFVSINSTNLAYIAVFNNPFYPSSRATVAEPQQMISIPFIDISESINFYKNTSQKFTQIGVGMKISGIPAPLKYNNPDVLYRFPITYLQSDTSESEYHIGIPDFGYYGQSKYRINLVDGWGKLYLPVNTFDVVRVKSIVKYKDTIYIDSLGFGFAIKRTETEYKWFTDSIHGPVLEIIKGNMNMASLKYYYNPLPNLSVEDTELKDNLKVFPNPANDYISIQIPDKNSTYLLRILDIAGREILKYEFGKVNEIKISIKELLPGIYLTELSTTENTFFGKFIKN